MAWGQSSKVERKGPEEDDGLNYRDGRLRAEFWAQKWDLFKECNACHNWTYVNRIHPLVLMFTVA